MTTEAIANGNFSSVAGAPNGHKLSQVSEEHVHENTGQRDKSKGREHNHPESVWRKKKRTKQAQKRKIGQAIWHKV
jgi:hypothetical protein